MPASFRLELPLLAAAQAQKHVTCNETFTLLDAIVHLAVLDRTRAGPPAAPVEGDRHLVAPGASGAWSGKVGQIAAFDSGAWRFFKPGPGWSAYVMAETRTVIYDGSSWGDPGVLSAPRVGVGATPDAVTRLAVASDASLFTAAGADHRLSINKSGPTATASLIFQSGYSGRAEFGLAGGDDFSIKVSANGSVWRQPITIKRDTGAVHVAATSIGAALEVAGACRVGQFTKAALPGPASIGPGGLAYVSDEVGGAVLAFSDGVAWRRVTDRAVVA